MKGLSQRLAQHIINLIIAELLLEAADSSVLINVYKLDVEYLAEVFPVLGSDVVREGAVVCTTCKNPSAGTNLECWLWNPKSRSNRELRHSLWLNALYLACDKAEAVAEVYYSGLDTLACLRCKHEASCLRLADTDAKEVYLELWLVGSDKRTYLEHVALEA